MNIYIYIFCRGRARSLGGLKPPLDPSISIVTSCIAPCVGDNVLVIGVDWSSEGNNGEMMVDIYSTEYRGLYRWNNYARLNM